MSNTEQSSFLSKETSPSFLRAIQWLIAGFIAMVGGQLTRVNWESRLDLGIVLIFVLVILVGILAITVKETRSNQQ